MQVGKRQVVVCALRHQGRADRRAGLFCANGRAQRAGKGQHVRAARFRQRQRVFVSVSVCVEDGLAAGRIRGEGLVHQSADTVNIDAPGGAAGLILLAPAVDQVVIADVIQMHAVHVVAAEHVG